MNNIYFSFKRAYQSSMRVTGFVLRRQGLTPARFDLMVAIGFRAPRLQRDLPLDLGVTGQTVGRMLRSLEALGYITRERCERDKRYRLVSLTADGLKRIQRAVAPQSFRLVQTLFALAIAVSSPSGRAGDRQATRLVRVLFGIARVFADKTSLEYKWPPEDSPTWRRPLAPAAPAAPARPAPPAAPATP